MLSTDHLIVIAAAVVSVLLQVFIAPHIAIGYAFPNFIAVGCLVITLVQPTMFKYGLPFVMGLVYDLISGGPVGAMAFTLTAAAAIVGWFFQRSNNDTLFMGIATAVLGVFFVELVFGAFLLIFGFSANLLAAFVFRTLPCFVYDVVLVAIMYPIAARFISGGTPIRSEITQLQ